MHLQCVRISSEGGEVKWEEGPNHVLTVPSSGVAQLAVEIDWGSHAEVAPQQAQQGQAQVRVAGLVNTAGSNPCAIG